MLENKISFNKKEYQKKYQKKYYLKNKERLFIKNKKYRLENPDKIKDISRKYHLKNADKINAKIRKYRSDPENIERLKAQAKGYRLKKKEADKIIHKNP